MAQRTGTRHVNRSSKYGKGARAKQQRKNFRKERWENDMKELETLKKRYEDIDSASISKFTDFPLSKKTRDGLLEAGYDVPTEIQRETIGVSLKGHDVLGAAKTGSGKTLAFLLPVIECLYQNRWTAIDGLGALIISPTRELAYQTFEVLCKIGKHHDFSAGLIIGGKDLQEEADKIHRTNIIICTPGRLLQHMDETSYFDCCNLLML
ncbi:putative ATP-dependent RNA helicase DDX10, partial [Saccoglossus kowalevskii]|uniref:ATP-dependent RNA helicase n=1 Tax=Saccoglossus kowalevskii TaxID=10224 RepID=A0ABM0M028_SACKO